MSPAYLTINGIYENTIIIEHSKFICFLKGVSDEADAKNFIDAIRKKHSLATHNCYAYIADDKGLIQKFSDDGEPQGTAGLPMLEVLKNKKLYKTVAVVTRYFGGIKLGTGGLTRAYSSSVVEAVEKAKIDNVFNSEIIEFELSYETYSKIIKFFDSEKVSIIETNFSDNVYVKIAVKSSCFDNFINSLNNAFNGKLDYKKLQSTYFSFR